MSLNFQYRYIGPWSTILSECYITWIVLDKQIVTHANTNTYMRGGGATQNRWCAWSWGERLISSHHMVSSTTTYATLTVISFTFVLKFCAALPDMVTSFTIHIQLTSVTSASSSLDISILLREGDVWMPQHRSLVQLKMRQQCTREYNRLHMWLLHSYSTWLRGDIVSRAPLLQFSRCGYRFDV